LASTLTRFHKHSTTDLDFGDCMADYTKSPIQSPCAIFVGYRLYFDMEDLSADNWFYSSCSSS
jgi:hypothetical protein